MPITVRRIVRWSMVAFLLAILTAAGLLVREPWQPLTEAQVQVRVAALLRYGAFDIPHQLAGPDHPDAALILRAAADQELSAAESRRYRRSIQAVLAKHQMRFAFLDNNIVFVINAGPGNPNNCGGLAIEGRHDLHAASALSNFVEMEDSLAKLKTAGPLGRIRHANRAYKNLTDIMVHLAPATQSVVLDMLPTLPATASANRAAQFETFRRAMQTASFAPVGSAKGKAALATAVLAFTRLVLDVQGDVTAKLSPLEQRIAGRWLSLQSVSPRLQVAVP